jgi:predicted SprT family Zn-dependent metalloprotease
VDNALRSLIAHWGAAWGLPDLADQVSISFSRRLTKSLGRCRPSTGRVTLRADLKQENPERLAEVLCHEVAHVAAFRLFGRAAAPHGAKWKQLVASAGYPPEVRARDVTPSQSPVHQPSPTLPYEHRCPVCQNVRYSRRPVGRWRCAECLDAGLSGEFVIIRHSRPDPL